MTRAMIRLSLLLLLAPVMLAGCGVLQGDDDEPPYWVSLKSNEANLRVGPSEAYRVQWVYRRKGLPMKVVRVHEGWRLVRDADGAQGWMSRPLLSPERTAIVAGKDSVAMRAEPGGEARLKWRIEPGVIGKLGDCEQGWCRLLVGERSGYVPADTLWGAGEP